jgi:hypothetical protein
VVDTRLTLATGTAETRGRAGDGDGPSRRSPHHLGSRQAFEVAESVADLRGYAVTPHVAQNTTNRRSAIDGRTTRILAMRSAGGCASALKRYLRDQDGRRLPQDPSRRSGPRRLDVHAYGHCLQSRPAAQAGECGGRSHARNLPRQCNNVAEPTPKPCPVSQLTGNTGIPGHSSTKPPWRGRVFP